MDILRKLRTFVREPEGFFTAVSVMVGGAFLLLIPPLQTPDEISHFLRAYQISQFELIPTVRDGTLGGNLPRSISKTVETLEGNPQLKFRADLKYDIHKTTAALHIPLNKQDKVFSIGSTSYAPLSYIPQAIGISVGALFNLPPVVLMYIARAATLCAWIGLIFAAIKIVPAKKWTFAGIGLLPMLVAQGISPGIDGASVGLGVLFIAIVLKYRTFSAIDRKKWLLLLLIGCLVALTKQTTIFVLGFVFLLKTSQFDTEKWKAIAKKALIIAGPILVFVAWTLLVSKLDIGGTSPIAGQSSSGQISYLIHHPLHFPRVVFNTFFSVSGDDVVRSFVGDFGWMDTPLGGAFISLGYILIAGMLFINYEPIKKKLTRINKYIISTAIILFILATCGALYLYYTPVGYQIVYGLQGRYFLLFLFMAIPLFASVQLKASKEHYVKFVCISSVALLLVSMLTIYIRYYITLFV